MAKDVHQAIKDVLVKEQGLSQDEAEAYLKQLKKDKRYQRTYIKRKQQERHSMAKSNEQLEQELNQNSIN